MSDDWQIRKDIDDLKSTVFDLESGQPNFISRDEFIQVVYGQLGMYELNGEFYSTFDTLLDKFDNDLNSLYDNLIKFNKQLVDFDEDNENLYEDLTKLDENLLSFIGSLSDLESSFIELDEQLNGDGTQSNTGFIGALSSLRSDLTTLQGQLSNFQCDSESLLRSLQLLNGKLTSFSGTLASYKTRLQQVLTESEYNELNDEMIELFYAISTTKGDVVTVQSDVSDINDTIGDPTSPATGTLWQNINTAQSTAEGVENTLFKGANGTGTTGQPATGTVMKNLKNVREVEVPAIQDTLYGDGDVDNPSEGSVLFELDESKQDVLGLQDTMYGDGDVDNPANGSLLKDMGTVKADIGTSNQPNTIKGNISTIRTDIGQVQTNTKGDLQTQVTDTYNQILIEVYGGAGYSTSNPKSGSLMALINDAKNTANSASSTASSAGTTASTALNNANDSLIKLYGGGNYTMANPKSDSVMGYINTINTNLYGGGNYTMANPKSDSTMGYIKTINTNLYGGGNYTMASPKSDSTMGYINTINTNIYGGSGYSMSSPKNGSLKALVNSASDTASNALQNANSANTQLYGGTGYSMSSPKDGSLKDLMNDAEALLTKYNTYMGMTDALLSSNGSLYSQITSLKNNTPINYKIDIYGLNTQSPKEIALNETALIRVTATRNGSPVTNLSSLKIKVTNKSGTTTTVSHDTTMMNGTDGMYDFKYTFTSGGMHTVSCEGEKAYIQITSWATINMIPSPLQLGTAWEVVTTFQLQYNPDVKLCQVRYVGKAPVYDNYSTTDFSGVIPSGYRPPTNMVIDTNRFGVVMAITTGGSVHFRGDPAIPAPSSNIQALGMWHY